MKKKVYIGLFIFILSFIIPGYTQEFTLYNITNSGLRSDQVFNISLADNDDKWISTNWGTVRFNNLAWDIYLDYNSGLPNNWSSQAVVDQNGIIWFATSEGLVKWDGSVWTTYNSSNTILRDDYIETLFVDSNNQLWIALHYDFWIYRLSGSDWFDIALPSSSSDFVNGFSEDNDGNIWITDHWDLLKLEGDTISTFEQNIDGVECIDTSIPDNIWVGTEEMGLWHFDGQNWTSYDTSNSPLLVNYVRDIAVEVNGDIWIGTYGGGLAKYDGANWQIFNSENSALPYDYITSIMIDSYGNKWIGTAGRGTAVLGDNYKYAHVINPSGGEQWQIGSTQTIKWETRNISLLHLEYSYNDGFSWNKIADSVQAGAEQYIWTVESQKPSIYGRIRIRDTSEPMVGATSINKFELQRFDWFTISEANSDLPSDEITDILFDPRSSGCMWIGTKNGLARYFDWDSWEIFRTNNSGLITNQIKSLCLDSDLNLWVGTAYHFWEQYGVSKFDGQTWTLYDQNNSQFPDNYAVNGMVFDDEHNELWLGLEAKWDGRSDHIGGGLARFDGNQWEFFNVSSQNFPSNTVRTLSFINNLLWVGLENYYYWSQLEMDIIRYYYEPVYSGLAAFDGNVIDIIDSSSSALPTNKINDIVEDGNHNLWIATDKGLVKRFNGQLQIFDQENSSLPDNNINCLYFDESEGLWIGTTNGLALYNFSDWTIFTTENSGLKDNYITAIAIDEQNIKWIGTAGSGLALYGENGTALKLKNTLESRLPKTSQLFYNYPNPFNSTTTIEFTLPKSEFVTLKIYNILGEEVAALVNEKLQSGNHTYTFDGKNLASGIYYYQLVAGEFQDVKKMILIK